MRVAIGAFTICLRDAVSAPRHFVELAAHKTLIEKIVFFALVMA